MMKNSYNPVADLVRSILEAEEFSGQIADHRLIEGADAEYGQSHIPWPTAINKLLEAKAIRLYSHQALACDHIRAGHSVVVSTPTASGKSLIYNLPVLEKFLQDPEARALYLFPLKALAQDQLSAFNALCTPWPRDARPSAALYDGDTGEPERQKIRLSPPTALITNPDMLHLGILPYHENWTAFLASLAFIVVDEAHTYRGIFGSHMAQIFRRLNRLCARYGANPTYIFCTATLGNPAELGQALMDAPKNSPPTLINKSGAPQGPKHYIFINPANSPATCAIELLKKALTNNLRTIVYCRSRRMAELISLWASQDSPWQGQISSYRAGYLPEERREIEARMATGELMAVISTSALELGIDIGGLDVCILVGYPGTVMQTLQRGGRVGRAKRESAVIIIAGEDALDQYFARNPDDFFSRPPEKAIINPLNEPIMIRHLECAAAESPLQAHERWLELPQTKSAVENLEKAGLLLSSSSGLEWLATRKNPQRGIDLRGCGQNYVIEDGTGRTIGTLDGFRAWKEAHPGAIYLHRGTSFLVDEIDSGRMRICANPCKTDWFTRVRGNKSTDILQVEARRALGSGAVFRGKLRVSEFITGYEKRSNAGQRLLCINPLQAPPHVFETEGIWFIIPDAIRAKLEENFIHFMGSIHAFEHAAIGMMPLQVMADRNDFGGISMPLHPQLGLSAVFIYDAIAGGAGLSGTAFDNAEDFLKTTLAAIVSCSCEDGCPSCVHSPKCGAGNRPLSKQGAIALLQELLKPSAEGEKICQGLEVTPAPDRIAPASSPKKRLRKTAPLISPQAEGFFQRLEEAAYAKIAPVLEPPKNYMVFDVETRKSASEVGGWRNAASMGVSVAVLYDASTNEFLDYQQHELGEFFARIAKAGAVIGFNSVAFDYEVLGPFAEICSPKGSSPFLLKALPTIDLLQRVCEKTRVRISLDNLARTTLGAPKSANGLLALRWWQEGKLKEITDYCKKDVELTRDLYLFGLKEKHLLYTNKAGAVVKTEVDFSLRL